MGSTEDIIGTAVAGTVAIYGMKTMKDIYSDKKRKKKGRLF